MSSETIRDLVHGLSERAGLKGLPVRAAVAGAAVCLALVAFAAWRWMPIPRGDAIVSGDVGQIVAAAQSAEPSASEAASSAALFVHVGGAVRRPGVYEVPDGSRVVEAVDAAGGLLPDACADAVNLARLAVDGEQILIPSEDEVEQGGATAPIGSQAGVGVPGANAQVDINSADAALLDTLPGIGPSTAAKIVSEREANGRFAGVDDLARVSGIGPKKLDALKDLVCAR